MSRKNTLRWILLKKTTKSAAPGKKFWICGALLGICLLCLITLSLFQGDKAREQANLLDKVQNLKGKLLMIHGAQDDVVVWQHSVKFLKAAVDNGIQLDYFVYPGHAHNVLGKDRVHLMQKVTDYFDQHLKK